MMRFHEFDYRYANDLIWNGGPGVYLWQEQEDSLGLQFNVSGETKGTDSFQGMPAVDTAATSVYVGPEVSFLWQKNLSAELGVDLPVLQKNSALQIVPDYRVRAAVGWKF